MTTVDKLRDLSYLYWNLFLNTRNAHWNIKASNFLELHKFFESIYQKAEDNADKIAERIVGMGDPYTVDTKSLDVFRSDLNGPKNAFREIIVGYETIQIKQKEIIKDLGDDEGTRNMLATMIEDNEIDLYKLNQFVF